MQTAAEQELLTVSEAAKLLRCSRSKAYQLMDSGKIAFFRIGTSRRVSRAAIEEFMASCAVPRRA